MAKTNNAEGGVNGVLPTITDTGSGDAFDLVTAGVDAGTIQEYTNVSRGHGNFAYRYATRAVSENANFEQSMVAAPVYFGRETMRIDVVPGAPTRLVQWKETSIGQVLGSIWITAGRVLQIRDGAAVVVYSFSNLITLGTWFRTEWKVMVDGSNVAQATVRLYDVDGQTRIEDSGNQLCPIAAGTAVSGWTSVKRGIFALANSPSATGFVYYDDLVMGAADYPGYPGSVGAFQ